MIILYIFALLIILSLLSGYIGSSSINLRVYLNKLTRLNYHFGVSSKEFNSKDGSHSLYILSIGLVFIEIDIEFIKMNNDTR